MDQADERERARCASEKPDEALRPERPRTATVANRECDYHYRQMPANPTQRHGRQQTPRRPRVADIELVACRRAELRFDEPPETEVRFFGEPGRASASGSAQTNLPEKVEPGAARLLSLLRTSFGPARGTPTTRRLALGAGGAIAGQLGESLHDPPGNLVDGPFGLIARRRLHRFTSFLIRRERLKEPTCSYR